MDLTLDTTYVRHGSDRKLLSLTKSISAAATQELLVAQMMVKATASAPTTIGKACTRMGGVRLLLFYSSVVALTTPQSLLLCNGFLLSSLQRPITTTSAPTWQQQQQWVVGCSALSSRITLRKVPINSRLWATNTDDIENTPDDTTLFDRPLLAFLDGLALFGFAAIGKASHSSVDGSVDLVAVAQTAAPLFGSHGMQQVVSMMIQHSRSTMLRVHTFRHHRL